ncbi:oxygen-independent coproporphyrinogen III oxidase [Fulvimarina sp. MAC3]|uniref:oxygen-independent coproporphyrinogen III oxidase n=1 Tax=Fulvimarina sp. MAC3 TaxID=3148887 RepID=UPI0031FBC23E
MPDRTLDPADITARYGEQVPRYTSYPTAPHFAEIGDDDLAARFLSELDRRAPVSVYLHIPYCDRLCWFCGCHTKMTRRYEPVARYVDSLVEEIAAFRTRAGRALTLDRLHLGGGSPSILKTEDFQRIREALEASFSISPDAEIAVEIDPSDVTEDTLAGLRRLDVNRVSIGVQDFDPDVQAAINRPQSFEVTRDVIAACRADGLTAINIDALYGLPRQTPERLMDTIGKVIELRPERIALFGYAHVPWMKSHQKMIDEADLPDQRQRFADCERAATRIASAGYETIGFDHFALPGDPLAKAARAGRLHRNFQGYTPDACETLIGFGASAISRYPGGFLQNIAPIETYRRAVSAGTSPAFRGYVMSEDDRIRAHAIERLMCDFELDLADLDARFGAAARPVVRSALATLAADPFGLAQVEDGVFRMNEVGRPFVRTVASWFDGYLDRSAAQYSKAV